MLLYKDRFKQLNKAIIRDILVTGFFRAVHDDVLDPKLKFLVPSE
jgi:hypothetical protein